MHTTIIAILVIADFRHISECNDVTYLFNAGIDLSEGVPSCAWCAHFTGGDSEGLGHCLIDTDGHGHAHEDQRACTSFVDEEEVYSQDDLEIELAKDEYRDRLMAAEADGLPF